MDNQKTENDTSAHNSSAANCYTDKAQFKVDEINKLGGVYLQQIWEYVNGNVEITKKGKLKLTIELPANEICVNPKGIPMKFDDYKLLPLLAFVETNKSV